MAVLAWRRRQDRGRGRGEIRGRTAEQSLLLETQCARRHAAARIGYNPHSVGRQWCGEKESVRGDHGDVVAGRRAKVEPGRHLSSGPESEIREDFGDQNQVRARGVGRAPAELGFNISMIEQLHSWL